ncbi:outer membrane protein assembly factor BamB family protein [Streptomyces bambusae]|uniref:PQQ-binding-like beta-propeller repeat protein n=1 Tax=Streptomyces bambusae TaxID=1550616 RepID=A0ABS6ZHL8_9ACTN|nr:PQQ-binding-like beta-propeller repeat protein [Streptomyces bambusae]MBW5486708.1 PQQ-binding-like beta-propeller repeat protein [Streptomyces bambusae]
MTVPPPPPNQPPGPDGYGHLPGPPQGYGYGYPQGPNPYAQQPQPQPQQQPQQPQGWGPYPGQGGGYPPQTPPQTPPGQGGGGPARNKRTPVIVAAAVAGALVLGAGAYFAFADGAGHDKPTAQGSADPSAPASPDKGDGKGDGKGAAPKPDINSGRKPGEDKVLWVQTNTVDLPGAGADAPAQWVVGDTVVKAAYKSVTAYGVSDGKERWTVLFPNKICTATHLTTTDGKTVLGYMDGQSENAKCNQLKMIDLKAGKEGWNKEVPSEGLFDIMVSPTLAISGDTVTVSRMGPTSAFKVSTGDKLWARTGEPTTDPGGCLPEKYAGGPKLIGVARCTDDGEEVQGSDPVTGKTTWFYKLPKDWKVSRVYSVDPVVVDVANKQKQERAIAVIGSDGKLRTQLSGEGSFNAQCDNVLLDRYLQSCWGAVVDTRANSIYLPTDGKSNEIVAFDLNTGKAKWRTPAEKDRRMLPLKAENGQLYAYVEAEKDKGGEVLAIPAAGGKPTTVLRNPSPPAATVENNIAAPQIDYADGRLFVSVTALRGSAKGVDEELLMAFGK